MNRATQLALNQINGRFYSRIAEQWPHKRKHPWPGFARIAAASGSVLDVGCGDGRFAQFLATQPAHSYLGIDSSPELLSVAARRGLGAAFEFRQADFVTTPVHEILQAARFDLIVVLGVLHHIPGSAQRTALVRALAQQLAPRGRLVFTIWRLDEDPRFAARNIAFATYNQRASEPIALDQLEPGDCLLRWDDQAETPRYCHFPDASETASLIEASGLEERERFRADGHENRMNEYVVLQAE
jgi:SAM-dependent methyltransferase